MVWNELPEVVLIQILGHLPLHDQLTARRVNKYWQLAIDRFVRREKELILFMNVYPRSTYWKHDQRDANLNNALRVNLKLLESDFFWSYFQKTRRLLVDQGTNGLCDAMIERIQVSFLDLQHLQFNSNTGFSLRANPSKRKLCLENLRTLHAETWDVPFDLNCPQLNEFAVFGNLAFNETTNKHTRLCLQRLRLLRVGELEYPDGFKFSNLQVLSSAVCPKSLDDFPALKELHYLPNSARAFRMNWTLEPLQTILEEKRALKRDQLHIYLHGFDLNAKTGRQIWDLYGVDHPNMFRFRINSGALRQLKRENTGSCNFSLQRKSLALDDLSDAELVDLEDKLPNSLIQSVECLSIKNLFKVSLNFFEIARRFHFIYSAFVYSELTQQQFDLLPDALPHLQEFIYRPKFFQRHRINFEFLAMFKSLNIISIGNLFLSIEEFRLILQRCKVFQKAYFFRPGRKWFLVIAKEPKEGAYHLEWSDNSQRAILRFLLKQPLTMKNCSTI